MANFNKLPFLNICVRHFPTNSSPLFQTFASTTSPPSQSHKHFHQAHHRQEELIKSAQENPTTLLLFWTFVKQAHTTKLLSKKLKLSSNSEAIVIQHPPVHHPLNASYDSAVGDP
jgi:hypothetical protein